MLIDIYGLNSSIKRYRLIDRILKQDPFYCFIQVTHLNIKDRTSPQGKSMKKKFKANRPSKKVFIAILILLKKEISNQNKSKQMGKDTMYSPKGKKNLPRGHCNC